METIKLNPNIPVTVSAKYVDLVSGKFGAQVRIKGTFDGAEGAMYLPGKSWANVKSLMAGGIIEIGQYPDEIEEGAKSVAIPIETRDFTLTLRKLASDKFPVLIANPGKGAVVTSAPAQQAPPSEGNGYLDAVVGNAPQPAPAQPAPKAASVSQIELQYESTLTWALDKVVPRLVKADIPVDAAAVNSIVATILIAKQRAA